MFGRRVLQGNSVTVSRDELLKVSKTNVMKALEVYDPSFRVKTNNQWGSDPNTLPEMQIRGQSSIGVKDLDRNTLSKSALENNPNLPIFIMDNFETTIQKVYDMDPNRIESITILKDAAATALYGSRAANGVVVITTVAPKSGEVRVTYNMVGTISMPNLNDYNLMNARQNWRQKWHPECTRLKGRIFGLKNKDRRIPGKTEKRAGGVTPIGWRNPCVRNLTINIVCT